MEERTTLTCRTIKITPDGFLMVINLNFTNLKITENLHGY